MKNYEGLLAIVSLDGEESVRDVASSISKEMEALGASMQEVEQLGYKKFAYNPRKLQGGHYVKFLFKTAPSSLIKIKEKIALKKEIYLQQYQRLS